MNENIFLRDEMLKKANISEDLFHQLELLKVIQPAGVTEDQTAFYSETTINHVNYVKKLLEMGYGVEEIRTIVKKVGLPKLSQSRGKEKAARKYLTIGGLTAAVGVSARTIKHWEEKGIIEAEMRTEGGFRLYPEVYIYLCKLILDLQLFGYSLEQIKTISDYFRNFLKINGNIETYEAAETNGKLDAMLEGIRDLRERMDLLKEGIDRWQELVNKKSREIQVLKRENQKRQKTTREKEQAAALGI